MSAATIVGLWSIQRTYTSSSKQRGRLSLISFSVQMATSLSWGFILRSTPILCVSCAKNSNCKQFFKSLNEQLWGWHWNKAIKVYLSQRCCWCTSNAAVSVVRFLNCLILTILCIWKTIYLFTQRWVLRPLYQILHPIAHCTPLHRWYDLHVMTHILCINTKYITHALAAIVRIALWYRLITSSTIILKSSWLLFPSKVMPKSRGVQLMPSPRWTSLSMICLA